MIGQSKDSTLQKLIDNKLVEQKDVKNFENYKEKIKTQSNASYLYGLFQSEYKNLTGHLYSELGSYFSFEETKLNDIEQKKVNQELTDYLSKLQKCELINDKQFHEYQTKIDANIYVCKIQFILEIMTQSFKAEYMAVEKLKAFADQLKDKGIVSSQFENLVTSIDNGKIENPIDFLSYCNNTVVINEKDYSNEPEIFLELIHKKTGSIIPELAFTDFNFKIVIDSTTFDDNFKFYDFLISLQSNGKNYKQKSFYRSYSLTKNTYSNSKIDSQEYYQIFNKILVDVKSPYRLHEIKTYNDDKLNEEAFGIMALTKEQEKMLHETNLYIIPSYENFKNKPTSIQIEKAIEEYTKTGLFSSLTTSQINQAKEKIAEQDNNDFNEILSAFPNIIYSYDTELANLEDPYAELIKEFAKISYNEFKPTNISNSFDIEKGKKTTLKFKLGTKSYSKIFKIDNDWIDSDFFAFVKAVVSENKLKGQFYELFTDGQDAQVIYLTTEQYDYLRAQKLLIFADQWQMEEE
ncbi:hypothetical protein GKZ90_0015350 [Flavobacterium sp. MC2016-06]|uniref:hypothetical protein n=1 Tax=Flavobacterium sp. MC2016-06 TaxID=2676308 RepID=UPI0012BAD9A2|nr:hypothetical protein [Flavobacterium sp. MC2016-06]MBU3860527.1 hypothetical protein [Flavobacterium sp. MC2016-06]